MENIRKIKIAFDLDGVIIDKPPFIPKSLLEWLFRGGTEDIFKCRYPKYSFDRLARKISHFYIFRPAIKENITYLQSLIGEKRYEFYIISSRYSFLKKETESWFERRKINGLFKKIHLNEKDLKPYLFKEQMLEKIKPNVFIDDDKKIINYLKKKFPKIKFVLFTKDISLGKSLG